MTDLQFEKFQGTGNDFIIFNSFLELSTEQIQFLCDRKFGIGADGIIYMRQGGAFDYDMMYYNADGSESFCGNGSRCSVMYAKLHGWIGNECKFNSNDGTHEAIIVGDQVHLKMHDVVDYEERNGDFILNTGSPHYITFRPNIDSIDIPQEAHKVRYSDEFRQEGINVNFLEHADNKLCIRTYERGVEDETLSCGTGVTAAVIADYLNNGSNDPSYSKFIDTKGGQLEVKFKRTVEGFTDIYLCGPAIYVYSGQITL